MQTTGRSAITLLLIGGLLAGLTGGALGQVESEAPEPSPSASSGPMLSPAPSPAELDTATSTYSLEALTAPVEEPPSRGTVLGMYEPYGTESLVVIDFSVKTEDFSTPPGVDMETPLYYQPGNAAQLCAKGSLRETEREKSLDRQRGCLLAIADAWLQHLRADDPQEAIEHFDRARAVFALASATLDAKALKWLEKTLHERLPATRFEIEAYDPDAKAGKAKVKTLLGRKTSKSTGASLLRSVRDAYAANLPFALDSEGEWVWPITGMPSNVGWQVVNVKNGKLNHATRAAMCIHDLRFVEKVKWPIDTSGTSFVIEPVYACWDLTRLMWDSYRATGSKEYRAAAEQAWAMLRKISPADAERIAKKGKWGKYEQPLR